MCVWAVRFDPSDRKWSAVVYKMLMETDIPDKGRGKGRVIAGRGRVLLMHESLVSLVCMNLKCLATALCGLEHGSERLIPSLYSASTYPNPSPYPACTRH